MDKSVLDRVINELSNSCKGIKFQLDIIEWIARFI